MQQLVDAPTPQALADLVARCDQINRFETQLTAAEEARIAALAAGILVMRQVLELPLLDAKNLPTRQGRIQHWALSASHLKEAETPVIHGVRGLFVLDEHEQVKLLSDRTWRGEWRSVTLWKNGEHGVSAAAMLEYLANLTSLAQRRAPDVARALLIRSQAVAATHGLLAVGPRQRGT
jgi:anti-sigma-K factor RskA